MWTSQLGTFRVCSSAGSTHLDDAFFRKFYFYPVPGENIPRDTWWYKPKTLSTNYNTILILISLSIFLPSQLDYIQNLIFTSANSKLFLEAAMWANENIRSYLIIATLPPWVTSEHCKSGLCIDFLCWPTQPSNPSTIRVASVIVFSVCSLSVLCSLSLFF